ncbi:ferredoxin:thioredoxin reductase [archaeon]|nr:ferredoxin:thioredoxin reductase [archaeon]
MGYDEVYKQMKEHAEKEGLKLNPDKQDVERVINGMLAKEVEYGKMYCPCRRVTDDEKENERIICPCAYHQQEIKDEGKCFCGLFVRGD